MYLPQITKLDFYLYLRPETFLVWMIYYANCFIYMLDLFVPEFKDIILFPICF